MKTQKKETRVYFPLRWKDKKTGKEHIYTMCGLPVFTMAKGSNGKRVKPIIHGIADTSTKVMKTPSYGIGGDLRMIPKTKEMQALYKKFPGLIQMTGTVMGVEYFIGVFVAPDWFLSSKNYDMTHRWVAESLIATPTNSMGRDNSLPLTFLLALMTEKGITGKERERLSDVATGAIIHMNGAGRFSDYDAMTISTLEYCSIMRGVLSKIFKVSPKKLALTEYTLAKRAIKWNIRKI